jgi:hypothetical protein
MVYLQHVIRVNSDSVTIVSRGICASCVLSGDAFAFGSLLCGQWLRVHTEGDVHAILSVVQAVQRFDICFCRKLLTTLSIAFRYIFIHIVLSVPSAHPSSITSVLLHPLHDLNRILEIKPYTNNIYTHIIRTTCTLLLPTFSHSTLYLRSILSIYSDNYT